MNSSASDRKLGRDMHCKANVKILAPTVCVTVTLVGVKEKQFNDNCVLISF